MASWSTFNSKTCSLRMSSPPHLKMRVVVQASFSESVQYRRQICPNGLIVESNSHERHWMDNSQSTLQAPAEQLRIACGDDDAGPTKTICRCDQRLQVQVRLAYTGAGFSNCDHLRSLCLLGGSVLSLLSVGGRPVGPLNFASQRAHVRAELAAMVDRMLYRHRQKIDSGRFDQTEQVDDVD